MNPIFTGPSRKHESVEARVLDLLQGRVASTLDLDALVQEFAKEYSYPVRSCDLNRGDCDSVSNVFADFLEDKGIKSHLLQGEGFVPPLGRDAEPLYLQLTGDLAFQKTPDKGLVHVVVQVEGGQVVDLTGRQFGSEYAEPIYSLSEFKQRWQHVSRAHRSERRVNKIRQMLLRGMLASSNWTTPEAATHLADTVENRVIAWRKTGRYWTNAEPITLYHGTTEDRLPSILEKGILFGNYALQYAYAKQIADIRREGKRGIVLEVTAPPGSIYPVFHGPPHIRTDSLSIAKPIRTFNVVEAASKKASLSPLEIFKGLRTPENDYDLSLWPNKTGDWFPELGYSLGWWDYEWDSIGGMLIKGQHGNDEEIQIAERIADRTSEATDRDGQYRWETKGKATKAAKEMIREILAYRQRSKTASQVIVTGPHPDKGGLSTSSNALVFRAQVGDAKAGYLLLDWGHDPRSLSVASVYTEPDFRRQGVSSHLHDAAWDYARKIGVLFKSGWVVSQENQHYWEKLEQAGHAVPHTDSYGTSWVRTATTPTDIHNLADELDIPWDDDPDFMAFCEQTVGEQHLDDMTPEDLDEVADAMQQSKTASPIIHPHTHPSYQPTGKEIWTITAHPKDGGRYGEIRATIQESPNPIGFLDWIQDKDGTHIGMVSVSEKFRRQGVATQMYKRLFQELGITKSDLLSAHQTEDGRLFRENARLGAHVDIAPLIKALRAVSDILEEARRLYDGDATEYLAWMEKHIDPLVEAVRDVDAAFTGKTMLRGSSDAHNVREVLEVGRHWEVYLSDGGYSRLVLHGPSERGPVMHFDPGLAGPTAKPLWDALVQQGYGTPGGHIKMAATGEPCAPQAQGVAWISPDGRWYDVPYGIGHGTWVIDQIVYTMGLFHRDWREYVTVPKAVEAMALAFEYQPKPDKVTTVVLVPPVYKTNASVQRFLSENGLVPNKPIPPDLNIRQVESVISDYEYDTGNKGIRLIERRVSDPLEIKQEEMRIALRKDDRLRGAISDSAYDKLFELDWIRVANVWAISLGEKTSEAAGDTWCEHLLRCISPGVDVEQQVVHIDGWGSLKGKMPVVEAVEALCSKPMQEKFWARVNGSRTASQRVFYRGRPTDRSLRLNGDGVLWLALSPDVAQSYGDEHWHTGGTGALWTVTLKPAAKIVDLSDLSNPVVQELKEKVSEIRTYTFGAISDEEWPSFADFGILEGYPWVSGFLKSRHVSGVLLRDSHNEMDHPSVALLTLSAIAEASVELFDRAARRVAAKYQKKKTIKTKDGDDMVVYEYSDRQVQNRDKEKAERLEKLRHSIDDLMGQVRKDIGDKDPKKRLTALAVALIDSTFERVGNSESADEGHFGVTGWLKEHLSFNGGKAKIKYTGKSGVDHVREITDKKLVSALKGCCEDKKPSDPILSFGKDDSEGLVKITSQDVNEYLKPYEISAKDLRGHHCNAQMKSKLKEVRKKGPKLPTDKKEREKLLKDEFKEALEATAEIIGHTPAILRKSYLVPGLEDAYLKDGTIMDKLKKSSIRVASLYLIADDPCNTGGISAAWITPEGRVHRIKGGMTHGEWAYEFLVKDHEEIREGGDPREWLLEAGWVRMSNYSSVEARAYPALSEKVMQATVGITLGCAVRKQDDPEHKIIYLSQGQHNSYLSLVDFVREWGGKKAEERLFEGLGQ